MGSKFTLKKIKPLVYSLLAAIIIATAAGIFVFLEKYLYQVLAQSEQIIILQKNIAQNIINLKEFEGAIQKIKAKTDASPNSQEISNPFK